MLHAWSWSFQNKSAGNMWFNDRRGNGQSGRPTASTCISRREPTTRSEFAGAFRHHAVSIVGGDTTGAQFSGREW